MLILSIILLTIAIRRIFTGVPFYHLRLRIADTAIRAAKGNLESKDALTGLAAVALLVYALTYLTITLIYMAFAFGYDTLQWPTIVYAVYYAGRFLYGTVFTKTQGTDEEKAIVAKASIKRYTASFVFDELLWMGYIIYIAAQVVMAH